MSINGQAFTVTQLNEYVKMLIDSDEVLQATAVCGEISNFKNHYATGHLYFTLKDEKSAVKCVMFARDASRLKFEPDNGMTVTVWGRISVFPRDGAYQLYVGFMSPLGLGDQHTAFERLKAKLAEEGLFDPSRKKKIPDFPKRIGIITSPTGAAVRDLLNILGRRWPIAEVELYPALVQGLGAPASLRSGVEYFNRTKSVDVVIIGRGGGSGEDLSAFNDEGLARAIAVSAIPIISAVGHETDVSISDFVADLRAPTPSAAAELAVPDMGEYGIRLTSLLGRIRGIVSRNIEYGENKLKSLAASAVLSNPIRNIEIRENELVSFARCLDSAYRQIVMSNESAFASSVAKLNALSPLSVLARGYSITEKDSEVITSAKNVTSGDELAIRFADGRISAVVK